MSENENKTILYLLCGLSNEGNADIKTNLVNAAHDKGYEAVCVSRYRKEGIAQYIAEHPEFRTVILQETMQYNYPYSAEELAGLADDYHLNIIISISKSHRANKYMKILYTAGITNALYEEDATVENILELISHPRTRRECRDYYNIVNSEDAMLALDIIDEERMSGYLSYLGNAENEEEVNSRYRYIENNLKIVENIYLAQNIPEGIRAWLLEDEKYLYYLGFKKKKRWPFRQKKAACGKKRTEEHIDDSIKNLQQPMHKNDEKTNREIPQDELDAGQIIEEDISDLLGFSSITNSTADKEFFSVPADETCETEILAADNLGEVKSSKKERNSLIMICVLVGVSIFLAIVILFGFFLYADQQEESKPAIPEQQLGKKLTNVSEEPENKKKNIRENTTKKIEDGSGNSEQTNFSVEKEEMTKEDKKNTQEKQTVNQKKDKPNTTEETGGEAIETYNQEITESVADPASIPAETLPPEPEFQVSVQNSQQVITSPETEPKPTNYDGLIFNGDEVARIAAEEEGNGVSIYIKTRESGEGNFSASEITGLVDSSCSYLAQGITRGQLTFIQQ